MGEKMKRLKTLFAILFCVLATSILGACSCSKDITVTKISLDTNQKEVVVETEFYIEFTLSPSKATNTKVFVNVIDGKDYISVKNDQFIVDRSYTEKVYFLANKVGTAIIEFKTEDKNLTSRCSVTVVEKPSALTAPQIIFKDGKVEWNAISSAKPNKSIDGYRVNINGSEFDLPATQTYYDGNGAGQIKLLPQTEYEIKVMALGNNIHDLNSEYGNTIKVNVLSTPENLVVNNGTITWDEVKNPLTQLINDVPLNINYKVEYAKDMFETTDALSFNFGVKDITNFNINVVAVVNEEYINGVTDEETLITTYVCNSGASEVKKVKKLNAPQNFKLISDQLDSLNRAKNSFLQWSAVSSATHYKVQLTNGTNNYVFDNITSTKFDFLDYISQDFAFESGEYTATVMAMGNTDQHVFGESLTKTQEISFIRLPFVTASINTTEDILTINTSALSALNLSSDNINSLAFELYFTNTSTQEVVFYKHSGSNVVNLAQVPGLEATEYVCGVRTVYNAPITDEQGNEILLVNNDLNLNQLINTSKFTKISGVNIINLTKEAYANFNNIENATEYKVIVKQNSTEVASVLVPSTSSYITVNENVATLDLNNVVDLTLLTENVNYKLQIVPQSTTAIDGGDADCGLFQFKKLTTPKNITVSNNIVTWDNQTNYGYVVSFNNVNSEILSDNKFAPLTGNILDSNTVEVVALGNDINTISSSPAKTTLHRLSAISSFSIENGELTWEEQLNNTFVIQYYSGTTLLKTVEVSTNYVSGLEQAGSSFGINVYRKQDGYFNSVPSATVLIKQLKQVDYSTILSQNNTTTITWESIEDATEYLVTYVKGGVTANLSTSSNTITLPLTAGVYNVNIIAKRVDNNPVNNEYILNSKPSSNARLEVLATPVISVKNGEIYITSSSTSYVNHFDLTIDSLSFTKTINTNGNNCTYDCSDIASGTYTISAKAYASEGTNVVHSEIGTLSNFTKVSAPSLYTDQGVLKFDSVVNATSYKLYAFDGSEYALLSNSSYSLSQVNGVYTLNLKTLNNGSLKLLSVASTGKVNSSLSNNFEFEKLNTPANAKITAGVITWNSVNNNTGYKITYNDQVWINAKDNQSFEVTNLASPGSYKYNVMAMGNSVTTGTGYLNSETTMVEVVVLNNPSGVRVQNSTVSWNAYSKASTSNLDAPESTLLKVYEYNQATGTSTLIYSKSLAVNVTSFDLTNISQIQNGNYKVSVTFIGNGDNVITSEEVFFATDATGSEDSMVVNKLDSPALYVENGQIYFNLVTSATSYQLYTKTGETYSLMSSSSYTLTKEDTRYLLTIKSMNSSIYTLSAKAITNTSGLLSSSLGSDINVQKLAKTSVSVSGGKISWQPVANAQHYLLKNINTGLTFTYQSNILDVQVESLGIDLTQQSSYTFSVQVLGSENAEAGLEIDGKTVFFLNGDVSTSNATVNIVTVVSEVSYDNGIITWKNVGGVYAYKLTITIEGIATPLILYKRVENAGSLTTSFDVESNVEIDDYTEDKSVNIVIEPYSLISDTHYIVDSEDHASITLTKPKVITDVFVSEGYLSWEISLTHLTIEERAELFAISGKKLSGELTEEENVVYQKYKRYLVFEVNLNGTISYVQGGFIEDVDPTVVGIVYKHTTGATVTSAKQYSLSVRSMGNTNTSSTDGVLPSNYSKTITGTKYPVMRTAKTEGGNIAFTKIPEISLSEKYLLRAIPANSDYPSREIKLTQNTSGTTGLVVLPDSDQAVIYDVFSLFTGDNALEYNMTYTYQLCLLGSENATENAILRSNYYNNVSINFLSPINSFQYTTNRGATAGGVLAWTPNEVERTQELYLLNISDYNACISAGTDWTKHENVIIKELPYDTNYFMFNSDIALDIPAGEYATAIKCKGDNVNYIEAKQLSNVVIVTKLNTIQKPGVSWLSSGLFNWSHDNSPAIYSYLIAIYEVDELGNKREVYKLNVNNTYTTFNLPDSFGKTDVNYAISITPLGNEYNGAYYVAGNAVMTDAYSRLENLTPYFDTTNSELKVRWAINSYADYYTVKVNSNENNVNQNYYDMSEYETGGEYSISVKAVSKNSTHLSGVYSNAITIRKMFLPEIRMENGIIVWGRNALETLSAEKTKIVVTPTDAYGNATGTPQIIFKTYNASNEQESYSFRLSEEYESGYYLVEVNFETTVMGSGSNYILGSEVSSLIVKKHEEVNIENGTYSNDGEGECSFENYIKWNAISNCDDYKVRVIRNDNKNPIVASKPYFSVSTDAELFEIKDGVVYFDLKYMRTYGASSITVYVTSLGNTTSYNATIPSAAYASSDEVSLQVDNPINDAPILTQTSEELNKGIIKWDSKGLNCMVEVWVEGRNAYKSVITSTSVSREIFDIGQKMYIVSAADEVFYLPYVGANFSVKLRYYNNTFAGNFTDTLTVHNSMFYSGSGEQDNPYVIYSTDQQEKANMFANIVYRPNSYIELHSDVDMINYKNATGNTMSWANNITALSNFNGVLNGNGYTVTNLSLSSKYESSNCYVALFNEIGENGVIKDINIHLSTTVGSSTSLLDNVHYGSLAITNNGLIQNVTLYGSINFDSCKKVNGGGIVYDNNATITNVKLGLNSANTFELNINSANSQEKYIGGIAFNNNNLITLSSLNYANINVKNSNNTTILGGFAVNNYSTILNCAVYENTNLNSNKIGGIVYENKANAQVVGCAYLGKITAVTTASTIIVGGIVGQNKGIVAQSFVVFDESAKLSVSAVTGSSVGGLVGYNISETQTKAIITGCYVVNNVLVSNCNYGIVVGTTTSEEINDIYAYTSNNTAVLVGNNQTTGSATINIVKLSLLAELASYKRDTNDNIVFENEQPIFDKVNTLNTYSTQTKFVLNGTYSIENNNVNVSFNNANMPLILEYMK